MKELNITTSKGEFILEEASDNNLGRVLVKYMTEEQFAEVVDHIKWSFTSGGEKIVYRNYISDKYLSMCIVVNTAKESFESLVKSLGYYLFENPYQYDWDELCRYGHGDFSKNGKSSYDLYMEAELKTFKNPILLKKGL